MTSQVLMPVAPTAEPSLGPSCKLESFKVRENQSEQSKDVSSISKLNNSDRRAASSAFPYQASHQAELLHLQAEADALLIQLQTLKQRRSEAVPVGAR
jgi:hypothetical protein